MKQIPDQTIISPADAAEITPIEVQTSGDQDDLTVVGANIPEDQMLLLLQSNPVVPAVNQDGMRLELMLDMDEESIIVIPVSGQETVLKLNRTIAKYSSYPHEQAAYQAMQEASFNVAEMLIQAAPGSYALIHGYNYWVSPVNGQLEIVCSAENDFDSDGVDPLNIFLVSSFEGLSAEDIDEIRMGMEAWLVNPEFKTADQDRLNTLVSAVYSDKAIRTESLRIEVGETANGG